MTVRANQAAGLPPSLRLCDLGWGGLGLVSLTLSMLPMQGADEGQLLLGVVATLFGGYVFWTHGGPQITAAGLYCLSVSVFVGLAGIWWWSQPLTTPSSVVIATRVGFWTTYGMYVLCWRAPRRLEVLRVGTQSPAQWGVVTGATASIVGSALGAVGVGSSVQFSLGGLALLMVSLMLSASDSGASWRLLLGAGVVGLFWETSFHGRGRLDLVALVLVALLLSSIRSHGKWIKNLTLVMLGPGIWLLVAVRERLGVTENGSAFNGVGSIVNPLEDFGLLVQNHTDGGFKFGHGSTFAATLLFWIPRSLWASKPSGFGSELTGILFPDLLRFGHSAAAHAYGEWYFNFGWLGVIAMIPLVGMAVRILDSQLVRVIAKVVNSRRRLLGLVILLILCANIPTFMWVGSFTYLSRSGQQILILVALGLPLAKGQVQPMFVRDRDAISR